MHLYKTIIKRCIILILLLIMQLPVRAQHIELIPFVGYETGAKMFTSIGDLRIDDGMNYGIGLGIGLAPGMILETSYNHLVSSITVDGGLTTSDMTDLWVDYYMLGALKELMPDRKATPFGALSFGLVNYHTLDSQYTSETVFGIDLAGGIKIKASEKIGIRLQARLHLPMYLNGLYFGAGTGGASAGVTSTVFMVQGDFTGSIYFIIDKTQK
jgi:hypothetical protein